MDTSAPETAVLAQRAGRPMATDVSVQIAGAPDQRAAAEAAADACMAWLAEVDARLSRFKPESELSRLNAAAGAWVAVSPVLFEALAVALWAAAASAGRFDPTLLRQLEALGYDRDFAEIAHRELPDRASAMPAPSRGQWRAIARDPERQRVRLPAGCALDLGGIAKGWAADVALERYCQQFPGALINVGGDLRAQGGPAPGTPWAVGITDPRTESATLAGAPPTHVAQVRLSRSGLATSGAVKRWWLCAGERRHHLLDPATGRPIPVWLDGEDGSTGRIATATALASTAARAEVAAKVALLRGAHDALHRVEAAWQRYGAVGPADDADAGVALVLTFGNGEVAASANLLEYLATAGTQGALLPMRVAPVRAAVTKGA
jgi:thiamine biosynthesis lipoprotein